MAVDISTKLRPGTRVVSLMILAALLLSLASAPGCRQQAAAPPKGAEVAPDFTLPDLSGNQVALGQLQGRTVLLNFWSTT